MDLFIMEFDNSGRTCQPSLPGRAADVTPSPHRLPSHFPDGQPMPPEPTPSPWPLPGLTANATLSPHSLPSRYQAGLLLPPTPPLTLTCTPAAHRPRLITSLCKYHTSQLLSVSMDCRMLKVIDVLHSCLQASTGTKYYYLNNLQSYGKNYHYDSNCSQTTGEDTITSIRKKRW